MTRAAARPATRRQPGRGAAVAAARPAAAAVIRREAVPAATTPLAQAHRAAVAAATAATTDARPSLYLRRGESSRLVSPSFSVRLLASESSHVPRARRDR